MYAINHQSEILKRKIENASDGVLPCIARLITERMTPENASILADFINNCIRENNIAINTRIAYIKNISHLERFLNHKAFNDMTQQDILSFLESHRKSEAADPLHKWVGTYNLILAILLRFFKWLYQPQINHKERRTPPILENIKMLKRKEKTVYQAKDMNAR